MMDSSLLVERCDRFCSGALSDSGGDSLHGKSRANGAEDLLDEFSSLVPFSDDSVCLPFIERFDDSTRPVIDRGSRLLRDRCIFEDISVTGAALDPTGLGLMRSQSGDDDSGLISVFARGHRRVDSDDNAVEDVPRD